MSETLQAQAAEMAAALFASVDDAAERAELQAIYERAAEAARQRTLAWELARPAPTLSNRPFTPLKRTEGPVPDPPPPYGPASDWAHDGTELWDIGPGGKRIPHGVGYRCLVCRDSRWVRQDVDVTDPAFGIPVACRCQSEHPAVRADVLRDRLARAGITAEIGRYSVESFQRRKGTDQALNAVYAITTAHRTAAESPRWLVLSGGTGRGKTHLIYAALQQMLPLVEGLAMPLGAFVAACKANQFERDEALTQQAITTPLLMLDEVGNHSEGDWVREKLERILNARYEARAWTLLGVTVAPGNVDAWSPRLASRFADRRLVVAATLTCSDYRQRETG